MLLVFLGEFVPLGLRGGRETHADRLGMSFRMKAQSDGLLLVSWPRMGRAR